MLANAQQDMEVSLAKMQLNKKVALTKSNNDKAAVLKKQNDELGNFFLLLSLTSDGRPDSLKNRLASWVEKHVFVANFQIL